jgi:hypothetical protein
VSGVGKGLKEIAEEYLSKSGKKVSGAVDDVSTALAAPQKWASKKLSEAAGLKDAGTSEANFTQLVDKGADALGVPKDSVIGNATKAAAVAAAEVFGDPLGFIPLGKVAKGIKGLSALSPLKATAKIAEQSNVIKMAEKARARDLDKLATVLKPKDMQFITDESSRATKTYKKLNKAGKAQEAAPSMSIKAEPPPKGKVQMGNDSALMSEAIDEAQKTGVPPERQAAWVQIYYRSHGGSK